MRKQVPVLTQQAEQRERAESNQSTQSGTILLVEDDPASARLVEEALAAMERSPALQTVRDGPSALSVLAPTDQDPDIPVPDLVLLDWHLPTGTGRDVLERLNRNREDHAVPVIVFTSSDDERAVREAYALNANAFVTKPDDLDDFIETITAIVDFWL